IHFRRKERGNAAAIPTFVAFESHAVRASETGVAADCHTSVVECAAIGVVDVGEFGPCEQGTPRVIACRVGEGSGISTHATIYAHLIRYGIRSGRSGLWARRETVPESKRWTFGRETFGVSSGTHHSVE